MRFTEEHKKKLSDAHKGKPIWNKGKKLSEEHKRKLSESKRGRSTWNKGLIGYGKGRIVSKETRDKLRNIFSKEGHPNWKGGLSFEPYTIDWNETLKRSIRERDHYVCQICLCNGWMVHHIDYEKKNCSPENLITLCHSCHSKTNYNRNFWKKYFYDRKIKFI